MEQITASVSQAGAMRAIVTVLRTMLDAQPNHSEAWRKLRAQYGQALAKFDADPALAAERASFEQVFHMLGILRPPEEEADHAGTARHLGRLAEPVAGNAAPTDGVDDASMY